MKNNRKKTLTLGAYKLVELARIEGVHRNTVDNRKAAGKYVEIAMRSPSGKVSTRYLTAEASAAILAVFSEKPGPSDLFPEVPRPPGTPDVGYLARSADET